MLLIKNANVMTMCGPVQECCDILIDEGKIAKIGKELTAEKEAVVMDATGLLATPGLIDAHCHMGMLDTGSDYNLYACNEASDPILPQLRAVDGYDPRSKSLKTALMGGVTTIATGPGSGNIIGGQFAIFKTAGGTIEKSLVKAPAAMKAAFGQNPMRFYGEMQKRAPYTRMGVASQLREFLTAAQDYAKAKAENAEGKKCAYNEKYEAMLPVMRGELPMKFGLRFTLDHCTQGHIDPAAIAGKPEGVIVGPYIYVADKQEVEDISFTTAAALHKQGLKVAIASDWPILPMELFPMQAGLSLRDGLTEEDVWRMITVNPAEILGISDRVGTIEVGKDADIVLFRGNPLREVGVYAQTTIINGQIVYSAEKE